MLKLLKVDLREDCKANFGGNVLKGEKSEREKQHEMLRLKLNVLTCESTAV